MQSLKLDWQSQRRVRTRVPLLGYTGSCFFAETGRLINQRLDLLLSFGAVAGAAICPPFRGLNPLCLAPLRSAAKGRLTPLYGGQLAAPATAPKESKRSSR